MHCLFSEMVNCPKFYSKMFHVPRFRRNALYEPEFFSNCVGLLWVQRGGRNWWENVLVSHAYNYKHHKIRFIDLIFSDLGTTYA